MLESNGVRCWIAPRDVTPGMEWSECIIDAIEECRVMVLVFYDSTQMSPDKFDGKRSKSRRGDSSDTD